MDDMLDRLRQLTGLEKEAFSSRLCQRASKPYQKGITCQQPRPRWLERAAAQWIIELWQWERNDCDSHQLWDVDRKYSQIFKSYTVAEMVVILSELGGQAT